MAKITANEYVKVAWVPDAYMTSQEAQAPSESVLNGPNTIQLSEAIAWQDFALGATDSDDVEDRGITDPGNATTRGFANFEGTLSFFRDKNPDDLTSPYVIAWNTFKTPRTHGYLVMRVAEKKWSDPWAAGDRVSVFKFIADVVIDDTEGDDSVKFTVNFMQQGILYPYTRVAGSPASVITGVDATGTMDVGDRSVLAPSLDGTGIRASADYTSSDPTVASVSANGVLTAVSAGTADITVSHPAAAAPIVQEVTVSSP